MNDIIGAIRSWLAAQSAISDLVGDRIYVNALPRSIIESQDTFRPQKMIVVQQGGGFGRADRQRLDNPSFAVLCYGETDYEADRVRREVWDALTLLDRARQSGVLIHHVNPASGAIVSRDPDIVWPIITQTFSAFAATEA